MPAKLDRQTRGKIVQLRALDYNKDEIADQLGVSRTTVDRYLAEYRRQAEEAGDPAAVVLGAVLAGEGSGIHQGRTLKASLDRLATE